jgi:putative hydrolase of the HAD superfamily
MASILAAPPSDLIRLWVDTFDQRMNGTFQNYQECIRYICRELEVSPDNSQIELAAQVRFDMTKHEMMSPKEDATEVLNSLKSQGYRIGLISNASSEASTVWSDAALSPFIDVALFSSPIRIMKPDHRIYLIVAAQLEVEPKDCVYVADGIGGELEGGMDPILLRAIVEDTYEEFREAWGGPVISSLRELLDLVE